MKNSTEIFEKALQLQSPWEVKEVEFKEGVGLATSRLEIEIGFQKGSKFKDKNGKESAIHDTIERSWQHLSFFQHQCFIKAKVPRIKTSTGEIETIVVPWARPGSGFTLLFEAYAMLLIENEMPVKKASALLQVTPHRIWRVFKYWIGIAVDKDVQTDVKNIGIDETSKKKGHDYVTLAVDLDQRRVIYVTPGKDSKTIERLRLHLEKKGTEKEQIKNISIDMSPSFISGVSSQFPEAAITFDKFHVVKIINEAMDTLRKLELKEYSILKGHKYTFLRSASNLSTTKKQQKNELLWALPKLGEGYRLKELFCFFWEAQTKDEAGAFLAYWCDLVEESGIQSFIKASKTLKAHWTGLVNFSISKINNGILEGINSKIQLAKKRARGFRNSDNFISMIYFIAGKLKFDYPLYSS